MKNLFVLVSLLFFIGAPESVFSMIRMSDCEIILKDSQSYLEYEASNELSENNSFSYAAIRKCMDGDNNYLYLLSEIDIYKNICIYEERLLTSNSIVYEQSPELFGDQIFLSMATDSTCPEYYSQVYTRLGGEDINTTSAIEIFQVVNESFNKALLSSSDSEQVFGEIPFYKQWFGNYKKFRKDFLEIRPNGNLNIGSIDMLIKSMQGQEWWDVLIYSDEVW